MFLRVRSLNTQNYNVKRCPAGVDRATRTSTPLDTTSLEPLQINLFGDFVEYSGVRALCSKYFGNTQIHVFKVATNPGFQRTRIWPGMQDATYEGAQGPTNRQHH